MLNTSTRASGSRARMRRVASIPLMPGRLMSITTTSGRSSQNSAVGLLAARRLGDHLDVGGALQQAAIAFAHDRVVVDQDHAHGHADSPHPATSVTRQAC